MAHKIYYLTIKVLKYILMKISGNKKKYYQVLVWVLEQRHLYMTKVKYLLYLALSPLS